MWHKKMYLFFSFSEIEFLWIIQCEIYRTTSCRELLVILNTRYKKNFNYVLPVFDYILLELINAYKLESLFFIYLFISFFNRIFFN